MTSKSDAWSDDFNDPRETGEGWQVNKKSKAAVTICYPKNVHKHAHSLS